VSHWNAENRLPSNRRLQLTAFGARDRLHFDSFCSASAAAEAQGVGWQAIKPCSFKIVNSCCCRTFVLHFTRNYISIVCISGAMHGSNLQTPPVDWLRMA